MKTFLLLLLACMLCCVAQAQRSTATSKLYMVQKTATTTFDSTRITNVVATMFSMQVANDGTDTLFFALVNDTSHSGSTYHYFKIFPLSTLGETFHFDAAQVPWVRCRAAGSTTKYRLFFW